MRGRVWSWLNATKTELKLAQGEFDVNKREQANWLRRFHAEMAVYHDEIEIEDFEYDEEEDLYTYPCVCSSKSLSQRRNS